MIDGRLYQLTQAALAERLEYEADYGDRGCSCHQCAPCGNCVHPGNPLNQDEDDEAWELVEQEPDDGFLTSGRGL